MNLGTLKPPKGGTRNRKRLGAGPGSGTGKTSGRGHKGQKSRSGAKSNPAFEGGQMPLHQRLPKFGFNNPFRVVYQIVNLEALARKGLSGEVTPETLRQAGLIRSLNQPVKILGQGDVSEALQIQVHAISASAREKVAQAGGSIALIGEVAE